MGFPAPSGQSWNINSPLFRNPLLLVHPLHKHRTVFNYHFRLPRNEISSAFRHLANIDDGIVSYMSTVLIIFFSLRQDELIYKFSFARQLQYSV